MKDGKTVWVEGLESHPLNKGKLCAKREAMLDNIYDPNRLRYPLKRTKDGWLRVTWEVALTEIADKLLKLKNEFGPSVLGVFSGSIGVENLEMAGLFATMKGAGIYQGTCTQDQTANGTQNSRAFSILQIITGNINNPGGWVISPRLPLGNVGMGVEGKPLGADQYLSFKSPYGVVTCAPESVPDKIKAFLVIGGNPLLSMADSNAFREAFKKLELLVVHDLFMTETAEQAHYVLPAVLTLKNGASHTPIMSVSVCLILCSEKRLLNHITRVGRNGNSLLSLQRNWA